VTDVVRERSPEEKLVGHAMRFIPAAPDRECALPVMRLSFCRSSCPSCEEIEARHFAAQALGHHLELVCRSWTGGSVEVVDAARICSGLMPIA